MGNTTTTPMTDALARLDAADIAVEQSKMTVSSSLLAKHARMGTASAASKAQVALRSAVSERYAAMRACLDAGFNDGHRLTIPRYLERSRMVYLADRSNPEARAEFAADLRSVLRGELHRHRVLIVDGVESDEIAELIAAP